MANVKVWNDHDFEYKEKYKDEVIVIPPKSHIMMPRSKAKHFQAQFSPFQREGSVENMGYKRVRIEEDLEEKAARYDQPFKFSTPDGTKFRTEYGMLRHMEEVTEITKDKKRKA